MPSLRSSSHNEQYRKHRSVTEPILKFGIFPFSVFSVKDEFSANKFSKNKVYAAAWGSSPTHYS